MANFTSTGSDTFPAGMVVKTTYALCDSSPQVSSSTYTDVSGCSISHTMEDSGNTLIVLGLGSCDRGSADGSSGVRITQSGSSIVQAENRDHNDNDGFAIPSIKVAGYSGANTFNMQVRSISSSNKVSIGVGKGYALIEVSA